jgi:hypothetical protein
MSGLKKYCIQTIKNKTHTHTPKERKKKKQHEHNFEELWDMLKKPI